MYPYTPRPARPRAIRCARPLSHEHGRFGSIPMTEASRAVGEAPEEGDSLGAVAQPAVQAHVQDEPRRDLVADAPEVGDDGVVSGAGPDPVDLPGQRPSLAEGTAHGESGRRLPVRPSLPLPEPRDEHVHVRMIGPEVAAEDGHQGLVNLSRAQAIRRSGGGDLHGDLDGLVDAEGPVVKVGPLPAHRHVPEPGRRESRARSLMEQAPAPDPQLEALCEPELHQEGSERHVSSWPWQGVLNAELQLGYVQLRCGC